MSRVKQRGTAPPRLTDAAAEEAAAALRSFRDAYGAFLHAYRWDHFVALTYKWAVPPAEAARDFRDGFVRRLAFDAGHPLAWFYALERDAAGDRVHVHALVARTAALTSDQVERAWRAGNTRVRRYDPARGGARYVVKSILPGSDDYDISRRRPPLLARAA